MRKWKDGAIEYRLGRRVKFRRVMVPAVGREVADALGRRLTGEYPVVEQLLDVNYAEGNGRPPCWRIIGRRAPFALRAY